MNLAHELNRIQSGHSSTHHWSDAFSSLFVLWAHSFCLTIFVQFLITQNFNQQVSITGFTTRFVLRKYHWQKIIRLHSLYRIPPSTHNGDQQFSVTGFTSSIAALSCIGVPKLSTLTGTVIISCAGEQVLEQLVCWSFQTCNSPMYQQTSLMQMIRQCPVHPYK